MLLSSRDVLKAQNFKTFFSMNFIDIFFLILSIYFVFKGFKNGLIIELTSLVSFVLGGLAGVYLSHYISGLLFAKGGFNPEVSYAISFLILFASVVIIVRLIAKAVTKVIDMAALGFINKLLGAVFGFLKLVFFAALFFYFIGMVDKENKFISKASLEKSKFYKWSQIISLTLFPEIPGYIDQVKEHTGNSEE